MHSGRSTENERKGQEEGEAANVVSGSVLKSLEYHSKEFVYIVWRFLSSGTTDPSMF